MALNRHSLGADHNRKSPRWKARASAILAIEALSGTLKYILGINTSLF